MNYREKMREYLKEPNEICNHYGKWGILNREQRDLITRLLNEMDAADNYIIKLQQENARLKDKLKDIKKILDADCCVENIYQAMCQYLNIHDFELNLEDYLKEN